MKSKLMKVGCAMAIMALVAVKSYAVTTNDLTTGGTALPAGMTPVVILEGTVDFAKNTATNAVDMFKVIKVPAGYTILGASVKMDRIESTAGAGTLAIGLWESAAISATNYFAISALMTDLTTVASSPLNSMTNMNATSYITVAPSTPCATGKVHVSACVIPFH